MDASESSIGALSLHVPDAPIRLGLPAEGMRDLVLSGHVDRVTVTGGSTSLLTLVIRSSGDRTAEPRTIEGVSGTEQMTALSLSHRALGQPISLKSLRAYPKLTDLSLSGSFTDFEVLAEFPQLCSLALRYVPEIVGMPSLTELPQLRSVIGWNIIDGPGKVLRAELRKVGKEREFDHARVTQLRTAEWFEDSYGLPYAGWESRAEKRTTKAHRAAQARLAEAGSAEQAESALTEFVQSFNAMEGIETSEREDVALAVVQLVEPAQVAGLVSEERALRIFDEVRDF